VTSSQGVLITSYGGLVANKPELIKQNFDYVILDEGHKIRNPDAQGSISQNCFVRKLFGYISSSKFSTFSTPKQIA
jgi:SNF2 family DNA or RNA helicase